MSVSTVDQIQSTVQRSVYDFSPVNTMGDLVGNRQFRHGYDELQLGQHTKDSYIWEALSAASENLGREVYSNVLHYIDNVSNVDVCKIKSLKSMLQLVGIDYLVIDKIQFYPLEIQSLIDILSINKKYLLMNDFMKKDFIDDLSANGIISAYLSVDPNSLSIGNAVSQLSTFVYDQNNFNRYLSSTFYNFIYDMLTMPLSPNNNLEVNEAYKYIELSDSYGPNQGVKVDKYRAQKRTFNIDMSFDVEAEVDKIEVGQASLDQYFGDKKKLLQLEIDDRRSAFQQLSAQSSTEYLQLRTAYYRKKKVIEYAKFVDNIVGLNSSISTYQTYDYDTSYYLNPNDRVDQQYVISGIGTDDVGLVLSCITAAAKNLTNIVNYTNKIREVIRQQVRKIFMKGTNNLLEYTINEFLIDYSNQLEQVFPRSQVSTIIQKLSSHSVDLVKVQEYWDQTEYFNISAVTSNKYSYGYRYVNPRYFDETFQNVDGKLTPTQNGIFTNDEINEFYLSTLNLKNGLDYAQSSFVQLGQRGLSSSFYDFLSVLFDIAADPSYYDEEYGVFGSKLSNQIITHDIFEDLTQLKEVSANVMSAATKANYEFSDAIQIIDQKEKLFSSLADVLQDEYLSAVSATYDEYAPQIQQLSTNFDSEKTKLSTYLNDTYSHYFCKSKNSYSYNEAGEYLFDYFVGNSNYPEDNYYILYLNQASSWITTHCYTYPLSNAINILSSKYDSVKLDIYTKIINNILLSGFVDLDLDDLSEQMNSVKAFLDQKIDFRTNYLQQSLDNFRQQANQLKNSYDQYAASFQQVLASMPDTSQGWYMQFVGEDAGSYKKTDSITGKHARIYDQYSQGMYVDASDDDDDDDEKNGEYEKVNFKSANNIQATDTLVTSINKAKARIAECKNIFYGYIKSSSASGVSRSYGSQEQALDAILANVSKLGEQIDSILNQIKQIYQIDSNSSEFKALYVSGSSSADIDIYKKILALIEYLGTKIDESCFARDLVLSSYNDYYKDLTNISADYIPAQNEYEVLWSVFTQFLVDFDKTSDYKVFKPLNIDKLDAYRRTKDSEALSEISQAFNALRSDYQALVDRFVDICKNDISLYQTVNTQYIYEYSGDVLEECLTDLLAKLENDTQIKEILGNKRIDDDLDYLEEQIDIISNGERASGKTGLYIKYFPTALGEFETYSAYETAFNSQYVSFTSIMDQLLQLLEYTNYDSFTESLQMFKNYTGISSKSISAEQWLVADDPYYNHKNLTHPSYQIHPFLWNFSEKRPIQQAIDIIATVYSNIDIAALEGSVIAKHLDEYLGRFGNLVNVWKTHIKDFTSYSTRYEQSNHICRYTNSYSEVVDYDGAFYPPALSVFVNSSRDTAMSNVSSYYEHLNLESDKQMLDKTIQNLQDNYDSIKSITELRQLSNIYDIFSYQVDTFGNMYILYKTYNNSQMSSAWQDGKQPAYHDKLNTIGKLWIRLCDSPLALPMSAVVDLENSAKYYYGTDIPMPLDYLNIHDVQIIPSGNKICLTIEDPKTRQMQTWPLYIQYDLKKSCGLGTLTFTSTSPKLELDGNSNVVPSNVIESRGTGNAVKFYKYVGSTPISTTEQAVVYIDAEGIQNNSSGIIDKTTIKIPNDPTVHVWIVGVNRYAYKKSQYKLNLTDIVDVNPTIAYYKGTKSQIDIAFVVERNSSVSSIRRLNAQISVDLSATVGYASVDPIHTDMNSFDMFSQDVVVASLNLGSTEGKYQKASYQTNADIGYIPSYAGLSVSGPLNLVEDINKSHQAIELLGKSKDLDALADAVNDKPDPYLTKDAIYDKYIFGRVWENEPTASNSQYRAQTSGNTFSYDRDQSLVIVDNEPMYQNMPAEGISYDNMVFKYESSTEEDNYFAWIIDLSKRYSSSDLSCLKLFAYNVRSLGKNPYIVDDLSNIMIQSQSGYIDANYNDQSLSDFNVPFNGYNLKVGGTLNGVDESGTLFSNHINNIGSIQYRFDDGRFIIKFVLDSIDQPTHIEKGSIKIALINSFDLKFFEWFHLLDEGSTYEDAITELGRVRGTPFTREQLMAIDLSKYNALSDVQVDAHRIFDSYRKMSFKVDEQDVFPLSSINYYIPSLNIKYPMSIAQAYDTAFASKTVNYQQTTNIFNSDELYVIDLQNASDLSAIAQIAFQDNLFEQANEIRVYEDYLSSDSELSIYNSGKYVLEDPLFYQYVHFVGNDVSSGAIDIGEQYWKNKEVKPGHNNDDFSWYINQKHLSALRSEELIDSSYGEIDFNWNSLTPQQKTQFMNAIKRFLRLYMNYKKSPEGIVLYANYQNFINSPFIKIEDDKILVDTIDSTYAKIMPNESKQIDIVLQFMQYHNDQLVSYRNVVFATYQIYNISDDKPKFLLKRVSSIVELAQSDVKSNTIDLVASNFVGSSESIGSGEFSYGIYIQGAAVKNLGNASIECVVTYQSDALDYIDSNNGVQKLADGTLKLAFTKSTSSYAVQFKKARDFDEKHKNARLPVLIVDYQSDSTVEIAAHDGYILLK